MKEFQQIKHVTEKTTVLASLNHVVVVVDHTLPIQLQISLRIMPKKLVQCPVGMSDGRSRLHTLYSTLKLFLFPWSSGAALP